MTYKMAVTKKGQMTWPKELRKALGIIPGRPAEVSLSEKGPGLVRVRPIPSILELAGKFKAPKGKSALKAREYMDKHYTR